MLHTKEEIDQLTISLEEGNNHLRQALADAIEVEKKLQVAVDRWDGRVCQLEADDVSY